MASNPAHGTVPSDGTDNIIAALQSVLQTFDGIKLDNMIQQGLDLKQIYIDPNKYHNALHELILNYCSYPPNTRPPKLISKCLDMITVLINNGLDINERDNKHQTVLHMVAASSGDHCDIISSLLRFKARINQPDSGQQTALHKAVVTGSQKNVEFLLDNKADPNLLDFMGQSPLHLAVKRRNNEEIIKLLAGCGGNINLNAPNWDKHQSRQGIGPTPLHVAARLGRTENAEILLELGADPNKQDTTGQTPVHIAAGHEVTGKLIKSLIEKRGQYEIGDTLTGEFPLHKAIKANMLENVQYLLLAVKANANSVDSFGETPLHKAAVSCTDMSVWRYLLGCGGKYDLKNHDGQTPLSKAAKFSNSVAVSVMTLFIEEGKKVESVDKR